MLCLTHMKTVIIQSILILSIVLAGRLAFAGNNMQEFGYRYDRIRALRWQTPTSSPSFKTQQLAYPRVKAAYREKEAMVRELLAAKGISTTRVDLFIRVFKRERVLEVWVKPKTQRTFVRLKEYPFCATSGTLGPKRQQGDGQIPEGLYQVDRFNPSSHFYLSLGVNYPNTADRSREKAHAALGGDIFIHGDCVTIGCVPLTDDKIKEVYLLAVEARSSGQARIPVHIFPARLTPATLTVLERQYALNKPLLAFWSSLKPFYDAFEMSATLPIFRTNAQGLYQLVGQ